ncbi:MULTISPECIES: ABC transporter substrate-binding protein [Psychrobacter]|jgi:putative ABC transport system substrate-binding protein|uniref:ABC transporter substrate-binding protein n=1 Tax=Psychrobacter TaxID=497 RepID=UPI000B41E05A|nr:MULTISPECIES: ABC transporter substrate-binding protein [Psychrobacter]MBE8608557.1 ABC transporter substrate-binding protein [Pseudomonas lundensis]MCG3808654.1 ABC transporter substrate-binding protein [Psychrobacter sp. Ps4]MCG3873602.1 ABC transporter substrate-binding protein [Psychrobacter sp. Ps7]HCI75271.1 ABC transporter substrate-binding protein [Psychrobacter sp.]
MLYQNRFGHFNFSKALLLGGVCTAILTGCNQSAQDTSTTDTAATGDAATAMKTVAITAIVEHPALDDVRKGVIDELNEAGFKDGENLKVNFQSAQGNTATAGQIAKQFVADNSDVIVAIGTPSAQSVAAATSSIPLVFSAVTDPVAAKLVTKLDGSGTNVTGGSDALPYEPQIELMRQIIPSLKNVGYVYSPGEVNSTIILKNLKEKLTPLGINVLEAPAQRSTDIAMAARSLEGKVDMIYTSTDNNVVSAYESLYQVAKESKIPLIASDTSSVERGAVAALGVNYYELGRETGKIVVRILNGEKAGAIPVYTPQMLDLYVSPKHAKEEGITLSQAVIDKAKEVVE